MYGESRECSVVWKDRVGVYISLPLVLLQNTGSINMALSVTFDSEYQEISRLNFKSFIFGSTNMKRSQLLRVNQ